MKRGDLVLTCGDLDPTGHHFIPYHTVCLVLGPPQGLEHGPVADAKVSILAANGVVADISKINLKLVSEG